MQTLISLEVTNSTLSESGDDALAFRVSAHISRCLERKAAADIIGEVGVYNASLVEDHKHLENTVQTLLFLALDASKAVRISNYKQEPIKLTVLEYLLLECATY